MDSMLVVFYSRTGNSRRVAELLATLRGWPLGEITDAQPRGVLRCLLDSLLQRKPEIRYEGPNPSNFRTVVLISPIWAWRLAGPMRSFIASHRSGLRRVAVVSTMGGSGAPNAEREVAQLLGRPPILAAAFTERAIQDGSCADRVAEFSEQLLPGSAQRQKPHPSVWQPRPAHSTPRRTR